MILGIAGHINEEVDMSFDSISSDDNSMLSPKSQVDEGIPHISMRNSRANAVRERRMANAKPSIHLGGLNLSRLTHDFQTHENGNIWDEYERKKNKLVYVKENLSKGKNKNPIPQKLPHGQSHSPDLNSLLKKFRGNVNAVKDRLKKVFEVSLRFQFFKFLQGSRSAHLGRRIHSW